MTKGLRKLALSGSACVLGMSLLTGCARFEGEYGNFTIGGHKLVKVNELRFDMEGVDNLTFDYTFEDITFYQSDGGELIIQDYMSEDDSRYYSDAEELDDTIRLMSGDESRNLTKLNFAMDVRVYLPADFNKNLKINTSSGYIETKEMDLDLLTLNIKSTSGDITLDNVTAPDINISSTSGYMYAGDIEADNINLKATSGDISSGDISGDLNCETTSGYITLGNITASDVDITSTSGDLSAAKVQADNIDLKTTSGYITCDKLVGHTALKTTSGDISVDSLSGSGEFQTTSGYVDAEYYEVTGDLNFKSTGGDITLALPEDLEYSYEAETNGTMSIHSLDNEFEGKDTYVGTIGNNPDITIKITSSSGDIDILDGSL